MEPSIKVFSNTNKENLKFTIEHKTLNINDVGFFIIHILTTDNLILKDCIFHEIDIVSTQNIETELQALLLVTPYIHKRRLCKDSFCQFLINYKLNIKDENSYNFTHGCYKNVKDKMQIMKLYSSNNLEDAVMHMNNIGIEYKIHYIIRNLDLTIGILNSINIDIMVYKQKVYFLLKVIEYYQNIGYYRKALYYQVRLYIILNPNIDYELKMYVYNNIKITGNNWKYIFTGLKTQSLQLNIYANANIRRIENLFIPQCYKNPSTTLYVIDSITIETNVEIYIKFIKTENSYIHLYQKSSNFVIPIQSSVRLVAVSYTIGNQECELKVNYQILKIKTKTYMQRVRNKKCHAKKANENIEFNTNVAAIQMISEDIDYEINNNRLLIKRPSNNDNAFKAVFLYKLDEEYECEMIVDFI